MSIEHSPRPNRLHEVHVALVLPASPGGTVRPGKVPVPGLRRFNATSQTTAERQRLRVLPVRPPSSGVKPVVPPKLIPRTRTHRPGRRTLQADERYEPPLESVVSQNLRR